MSQWLVLDIGNTHTVAGLFRAPEQDLRRLPPEALKSKWSIRFRTDPLATADEYRTHLTQLFASAGAQSLAGTEAHAQGATSSAWSSTAASATALSTAAPMDFWRETTRVIVSTVVPALESVVRAASKPLPFLSINAETRREFELDLPYPTQLGADRLANVAGALTLVSPPFLIVDAGTATTFCLVDDRPAYIGGAIVPGLETGWKALQARAAKLFSVELVRPRSSIGNTTETQLQSGVLLGYEALIEGMTDRLLKDAGEAFASQAKLFATGGVVNLLKLSPRFRVEPDLTLRGLLHYGQLTQ